MHAMYYISSHVDHAFFTYFLRHRVLHMYMRQGFACIECHKRENTIEECERDRERVREREREIESRRGCAKEFTCVMIQNGVRFSYADISLGTSTNSF